MPETLPLFPLDGVLFPEMLMPLHIFEPRYRMLVKRSLDRSEPFGIVLSGSTGEGGGPHQVGTAAEIVGHQPLPDGRSFIVVRGGRRFAIERIDADAAPYLVGRVRYLDEDEGSESTDAAREAADLFSEYLHSILAATDEPRSEAPDVASMGAGSPREIAYRIAASLAIDSAERQRLLEAPSTAERLASELRLLERENALLKELLLRLRASSEPSKLN